MHAVEAGALSEGDVVELGQVLAGAASGRHCDDEITVFDSTGLAIQDLAIALAVLRRYEEGGLEALADVETIDAG